MEANVRPMNPPPRSRAAARTLARARSASPRWRGALVPSLVALTSCVTSPAPSHPRPPLPLPDADLARFALAEPVVVQALDVKGGDRTEVYWRGALGCGEETATFHLLCPRARTPRPLVVCLPILAGGSELMWSVASGMVARGYAAAWVDRVAPALRAHQRGHDLDVLFRRTLLHNRMLLRWAERRSDLFAAGQRAVLGISTGGLVGTVLMALEPGVAAAALCLAGGDVPSLLLTSSEGRASRWRDARARLDGLAGTRLQREVERELTVDPARYGAYVATERVFLVHAGLDTVVPAHHHRLLWESLGRPRDLCLSWLGHYSAALALDAILDAVAGFFAERLAAHAAARVERPGGGKARRSNTFRPAARICARACMTRVGGGRIGRAKAMELRGSGPHASAAAYCVGAKASLARPRRDLFHLRPLPIRLP